MLGLVYTCDCLLQGTDQLDLCRRGRAFLLQSQSQSCSRRFDQADSTTQFITAELYQAGELRSKLSLLHREAFS